MMITSRGSDVVTEVRRVRNAVVDRARDRYEMDPRDQIRIQRECDASELEIVGYYHSHPDHPAQASLTDAQRSWAGPVYLIVSCVKGSVVDGNAFVAEHDGGPMRAEPLEVVTPGGTWRSAAAPGRSRWSPAEAHGAQPRRRAASGSRSRLPARSPEHPHSIAQSSDGLRSQS